MSVCRKHSLYPPIRNEPHHCNDRIDRVRDVFVYKRQKDRQNIGNDRDLPFQVVPYRFAKGGVFFHLSDELVYSEGSDKQILKSTGRRHKLLSVRAQSDFLPSSQ